MKPIGQWLRLLSRPNVFRPSRIIEAAQTFVSIEASSGLVLLAASIVGLVWINSPWGNSYEELWHSEIVLRTGVFSFEEDLLHLVNDGLMTVFFSWSGWR